MLSIRSRISKWGNSQAVRILKPVLEQAGMRQGEVLEIRVEAGRIILEAPNSAPTLEFLVAQITPENRHRELDWGKPFGREVW